ncbi:3-phenylpropionate/cinnamic acid dioxygenase subunit beta [Nocardia sp. R6R-6]|uniref:3-phenylpropionate/cinnamic acid dioxygenase subunit beta n=1 Tax=Nocardia sp. R6R-6 TaxID=3459303 RepID=UPI00403D84BF
MTTTTDTSLPGSRPGVRPLLNAQEQHELEHFYFYEASLLDEERFRDWLDLFADDLHYWMPVRQTRLASQMDHAFTQRNEIGIFDDDKAFLTLRVEKLLTGYSWSEDPPSRTRHIYSNIRAVDRNDQGELTVSVNFLLYRSRYEHEEDTWVGRREDVLRPDPETVFKIARRSIYLEQTVILAKNLSNFF